MITLRHVPRSMFLAAGAAGFVVKLSVRTGIAFLLLAQFLGQAGRASTIYDAVSNFSLSSNPNGTWSYLYDQGLGLQPLPDSIQNANAATGLNEWWNGQSQPNSISVCQNTSGGTLTYSTTIVQPPNLLALDPEDHTVIVRWTAPESGTWTLTGLFQGIDTSQKAHEVAILENYSTIVLSPTAISAYGQQVPFSESLPLTAGENLDFVVASTGGYTNFSTGLSATISIPSVPEPSTLALLGAGAIGLIGYRWRRKPRTT